MGHALLFITLGLGALGDGASPVVVCDQPRVTTENDIPPLWLNAIRDACDVLRSNEAIDRAAWVRVLWLAPDMLLDVSTSDGREAVRRVSDAQALREKLEALIVLPLVAEQPKAAEPTAAPTTTSPPAQLETSEQRLSTDVGFGLDGRIGTSGRHAFGPSAFAALHVSSWLVGASLRWDALQNDADNTIPQYEAQTVALGLTVGRRVREGYVNLDYAIEPRVVSLAQSHGEGSNEHRTSTTDLFVGGLVRAAIGHGTMRPYVQADVELAPNRLKRVADDASVYAPGPSWNAGLTAGLQWTLQ